MKAVKLSVFWALALFLTAGIFSPQGVDASENKVLNIDPAGVQKLIESDSCPVIISFVTARCGACRQEMPVYQQMYDQFKDQGLEIYLISIDFAYSQPIQNIVDQLNITYPVFWGGDQVMYAFDISLVPYKMVIQNKKVVDTVIGAWSAREIEEKVTELMVTCAK
jgi:cytochrome c biogenesis protein CcmG, thiol:disulfide interchange protein DsbE